MTRPAPADPAVIADSAAAAKSDIVIGLNGDADTYVLTGEEYLEAGAHATDPVHGILNSEVTAAGEVDTTKAGDYTVTYTVADPDGGTATAERCVHVVDNHGDHADGRPRAHVPLRLHGGRPSREPQRQLPARHQARRAARLPHENEFYFPSYEEVRAYLAGTHSLPAKSIVLTFDDGEAGFLSRGIELLEEYQVPATSFIIASEPDAASASSRTRART